MRRDSRDPLVKTMEIGTRIALVSEEISTEIRAENRSKKESKKQQKNTKSTFAAEDGVRAARVLWNGSQVL